LNKVNPRKTGDNETVYSKKPNAENDKASKDRIESCMKEIVLQMKLRLILIMIAILIEMIRIVSFNCYGFKGSYVLIRQLARENDITFLIETWLAHEESHIILEAFIETHNIESTQFFSNQEKLVGRPYGGLCLLIKKSIEYSISHINDSIIKLSVINANKAFNVYLIWMPYDDNRTEAFIEFKQNLETLRVHETLTLAISLLET
jgi:23S rRNA A2030 N6-methylase RlmJ